MQVLLVSTRPRLPSSCLAPANSQPYSAWVSACVQGAAQRRIKYPLSCAKLKTALHVIEMLFIFLTHNLLLSHNLLPLICLTDIDRPKGLTFTEVDVDSIKIAWESPQGQVTRYRVTYSSPEDGIHELLPAPGGEEDTAELHGLRPGSEYTINIVAIYDDMESLPLTGTQSTGTPLTTPPSRPWQQWLLPCWVKCASMCNWCSMLGKPQG